MPSQTDIDCYAQRPSRARKAAPPNNLWVARVLCNHWQPGTDTFVPIYKTVCVEAANSGEALRKVEEFGTAISVQPDRRIFPRMS